MKKFIFIKDFINYASRCLFCGNKMKIVIAPHTNKHSTKTVNYGLLMKKVSGSPLYRDVIEKSPLNVNYNYFSRVEDKNMVISCTEKYWAEKQPPQTYDVITIDIDTSEVILKPEVNIGILNSFVRINFKLSSVCELPECSGHTCSSTQILAGAKTKKLMPFFLRDESMVMPNNDDGLIYTLRSDYYSQVTQLEKTNAPKDYNNAFVGINSSEPPVNLPLVDMSVITTKAIFENKVENYVTFS